MPTPLFIYDGDCGFCRHSLDRISRVLPRWPHTRAWQSVDLASVGLTPRQASEAAWWIDSDGVPAGGARAFAALLRWQPARRWRFLGTLLSTPPVSWAAALIYRAVARWRHRLPGATSSCSLSPHAGGDAR
ncbi:hypothetical protein GCM10010517_40700 [Streptosporangium fragile]|uniref:DUF393 domain-containing protein n=1 Tax=Streptosporangium fragile TaxID=46186 RepID=A0ABN3W044_9ACTN